MKGNAQTTKLKRKSSDDDITSLLMLTVENKVAEAKNFIAKINLEELTDEDHHELSWTIANNRRDGGETDSSHIVIQHLIESGFKIEAIKETKDKNGKVTERTDLIDQIAKQSGNFDHPRYHTDLAIVLTILKTGRITVFEEETLEDTIGKLERKEILISSLKNRDFLKIKEEEIANPKEAENKYKILDGQTPNPTVENPTISSAQDHCCIIS